jgi:PAS domain S-box-containing protein
MAQERLHEERPEAGPRLRGIVHHAANGNGPSVQEPAAQPIHLPLEAQALVKRYGVALALAVLALLLRGVLPFKEGTAIYQLPLAAVLLSAWYGGRGPGLLASLTCVTVALYRFVPPVNSFAVDREHALGFFFFVALCLLLTEFGASRRRAEHAVRASEERFRTLVQFSFDVYWESDAQHRFTRQEFSERLTDAPAPGSEIGKTRWEVPHVEPDEEAWRRHRATMDAHLPFRDFELARPTADGGKRHVSVSGMPVFDGRGRFTGYRGVGRHISERKRAEAEHRAYVWFLESMDRINRAMQGTNDVEKMMSDVLDAALEIFACDRAWLLYPCDPNAKSWRAVMEHTRPEFPGAAARGRELPMSPDAVDVARAALDSRGTLPAGPGHERQVKPQIAERFGVRSEMLMALRPQGDQPYLFGVHQCSRARTWTKEEQRLFEEIAHRLTDALGSLIAFRSLRESERRLDAAQRVARIGWWERDYETGHVTLSDGACEIFGVQPVDLPHWHGRWVSLIHPEDREKTAAASDRALAGGPRYDVEYRVARPDGVLRVVHSQGDVMRDESGRPVRQFGVMQDITELRLAEEELRASEARFRTFVDRATDGFFLMDEQLQVVDVNRQACESLGRSRDELIGMHPGEFDVGLDEASIERLAQRAGAGEIITFETRHRRKDGSVFPVEIRTGTFQQGGRLLYLALARDITERKRAEEDLRASEARFRTFVDHATDGFFLHDEHAVVIDVNRHACESMGYSRDELIGMHPREFDAGLDAASIARLGKRVGLGETVTFESRHRRKDGSVFPVEIRVREFQQGKRRLHHSIVRDITERKLAEETLRGKDKALEVARAELARVSRLTTLGELTTSIAHEVSQPLGAMITSAAAGALWLAAEPPDVAEARMALDNIVADGKRAREVIGRIRALTKRQAPRKERLDVNQKILQVLEVTERELRSRDIALRTELDTKLPSVAADRVQLQQVLLNLILNAIDAMSDVNDRPRELTIVSRLEGLDAVMVEVRDSGTGLGPGNAERIFESFYTTKSEGIGIGLSISRSIVEAHGGHLWASANEPHGAVFKFSLPVAREDE